MRTYFVERNIAETKIKLTLNLDGSGKSNINSGVGFLDHMLTLFARHGDFDLDVVCDGDVQVDDHHSVEDIGIALGVAFAGALGDMRGIKRYGDIVLPMDESLVIAAVDISGRPYLSCDLKIPTQKVGSFDTELVEEFFWAVVRKCPMTLHFKKMSGTNSHHIIEAAFKAFGRIMNTATSIDQKHVGEIPSTKGVL